MNILYIGGRIYPTATANSINSINVIEELVNMGHSVTYIALDQDVTEPTILLDKVNVYAIKCTKFGMLLNKSNEQELNLLERIKFEFHTIIRKIRNAIYLLKFPDVDPTQSNEAFTLADKLHKKLSFDAVVGVFRSFSGVSAAIMMKKKYPDLVCGGYYLDIIAGSKKPSLIPNILYRYLCKRGELGAFSKLDFLLMPISGKKIYSDIAYKNIESKIRYVDFPLFKINDVNCSYYLDFEQHKLNLVFAGFLDSDYRNPEFMLKVLKALSKQTKPIVLHIYGRGNCNNIINKYKDITNFEIIIHGMVSHDEVLCALEKADFLINISNKMENMVPSKIFELFSTGKPIINFIYNKDDISNIYFDKYPSECRIFEWGNIEDECQKALDYVQKEIGVKYSKLDIEKKYFENTPHYTANILVESIQKSLIVK